MQEYQCKCKHQDRPDQPVLQEREAQYALVTEDLVQLLIANARERRIHHENEARRNWN